MALTALSWSALSPPRERLADSGVDKGVWNELRNQLDALKLKVKNG
jgi:hypothetical protein